MHHPVPRSDGPSMRSVLGRMANSFSCEPFAITRGNAIEVLEQPQNKVGLVITSPAYYQQRIYGTSVSELGREPPVAEYISNLVDVFRATPLEPWGSIWVTACLE